MHLDWSETESQFARRVVRRKALFLKLSLAGVVAATGLVGYYGYRFSQDGAESVGLHLAVVILVLLNARQNLRQYRYARLLESVLASENLGGRIEAEE